MQAAFAKRLFLGVEWFRGERVSTYLAEMEATQWKSPQDISQMRTERLSRLIQHVSSDNPYYQRKYAGLEPRDDFQSLPLLSKQELRANYKNIITPGSERHLALCKTSGSTGEPLKFYRDKSVFGRTLGSVYRAHRWYGLDIGAREAMLWGIPSAPAARLKMRVRDLVLNRFRESEYNLSTEVMENFYEQMRRKRPAYLFGYSSMVYEFALYCRARGLPAEHLDLKAAICTAESVHPHQRTMIESVFGCPVVSEYGAAETGIISYQCPSGSHHLSDDVLHVEVIGPDGREVPTGEIGKVVVTVLFSSAAPVIRYELGDYAVRGTGGCSCGVNLSRLETIVGRTSGIIVTPSGRCFHSIALYYIMKDYAERFEGIRQFRVRQTHKDRLEFHLATEHSFSSDAKEWLVGMVKSKFGDSMHVEFYSHDQLERSASGKLSDFESELDMETELMESFKVSF